MQPQSEVDGLDTSGRVADVSSIKRLKSLTSISNGSSKRCAHLRTELACVSWLLPPAFISSGSPVMG